ncbi:MAG: hypothetical protein GF411_19935 [Candidatus Lokiarchaeota archaeon]|nr:hypothetical protein [Candidatus Lokiarchaeota archaeon]
MAKKTKKKVVKKKTDDKKEDKPKRIGKTLSLRVDVDVPFYCEANGIEVPVGKTEYNEIRNELRTIIRNDIKRYRFVLRQAASILAFAATVTQHIEFKDDDIRVYATSEEMKETLRTLFGRDGAACFYSLREWVIERLGGWRTEHWDHMRNELQTNWFAKDPQFGASRGWLILNCARIPALFHNAPINFLPCSVKVDDGGHHISLSVRPRERFGLRIASTDKSQWFLWNRILNNDGYRMGTCKLCINRKHQWKFLVTYTCEETKSVLNPKRTLEVAFTDDPKKFIQFAMRSGHKTLIDDLRNKHLDATAAIRILDKFKAQQRYLEEERDACRYGRGGYNKAYKAVNKRRAKYTEGRERVCANWNHTWSKRIITIAQQWDCGNIEVFNMPSHSVKKKNLEKHGAAAAIEECAMQEEIRSNLFGREWAWFDFAQKVKYKARDAGCKVKFIENVDIDHILDIGASVS